MLELFFLSASLSVEFCRFGRISSFCVKMPLPPKLPVPHIVGDDEPDTDAPMSPDRRLETDSCLSDSSYEYDDESGDVSSSSDGTDWSMNVTRIAATPGRVPIYAATPLMKSAVVVEEQSPALADEDNGHPIKKMDVDMEEPSLLSFLNLHPTSQVTTNGVDMDTDDLEEQVPTSTSSKDGLSPKPGSSRNSGKAIAAAQTQSVRSLRSASGIMSKRVAGRAGRIPRIKGIPNNTVAKPLNITSYFRVVSAKLVRNRVTENAFQIISKTIDLFLAKTSEIH